MAMAVMMPPRRRKGRLFSLSKVLRCVWVLFIPVLFFQLALLYSCSTLSDSGRGNGKDGSDGARPSLNWVSSVRLPLPAKENYVESTVAGAAKKGKGGFHGDIAMLRMESHAEEAGDWFDAERWRSNNHHNNTIATDNCFYVENVCRGGPRRFRYDPRRGATTAPHQPNWELQLTFDGRHFPKAKQGFPPVVGVGIGGDDDGVEATSKQHTCTGYRYSPIRNHMVLQSAHNHMLGEFYDRTLLGLLAVQETMTMTTTTRSQSWNQSQSDFHDGRVQSGGPASTSQSTLASLWMEQTQLYLHVTEPDAAGAPLLDSHRLYIEAFSDNPVLSFYDALLDGSGAGAGIAAGGRGNSCRCLRRLFFCGYSQQARGIKAKPKSERRMTGHDDENPDIHTDVASNANTDANITVLVPNRRFGGWKEIEWYYDNRPFRHLRRHLQRTIVDNNALLDIEVERYQTQVLRGVLHTTGNYTATARKLIGDERQETLSTSSVSDVGGWKFVGLTQRSGRRKWLNLGKVLRRCNRIFNKKKIVCTVVNVEKAERRNALSHVVLHRALHVLVGIHGAQLTDAVWMRDESTVLELLPYVPDDLERGQWARYVHCPTPLGKVFHETELVHVGYRLPRESAPYCRDQYGVDGVSNAAKDDGAGMPADTYHDDKVTVAAEFARKLTTNTTEKGNVYLTKGDDSKDGNVSLACWKKETWADRDFTVDPRVVKRAIQTFLIHDDGKTADDAWHRFNGSNLLNDCLRLRLRAARQKEAGKDAHSAVVGDFVLYNVLCTENPEEIGGNRVHHFYLPSPTT